MKCILILAIMIFSPMSFSAGGCGGHGGDSYSLEFYRIGKHLTDEFKRWDHEDFADFKPSFSPAEFEAAVESTRIVSVLEELRINDAEVDAINYSSPTMMIKINRKRWDQIGDSRIRKLGIVLHEYLGIMKSMFNSGEWDNYTVSHKLLSIYITKNLTKRDFTHAKKIIALKKSFEESTMPTLQAKGKSLTCLEYSTIEKDSSIFIQKGAYLLIDGHNQNLGSWQPQASFRAGPNEFIRTWRDIDPTEEMDHPKSMIKEFIRQNSFGDLIIEVSTDYKYSNQSASLVDSSRGVISYFHCPKLDNEILEKMDYLFTSLLPFFDVPKTENYELYVKKIETLKDSKNVKKCEEKGHVPSCEKVIKMLSEIKLEAETIAIENSKQNISKLNTWLESLPDDQNAIAYTNTSSIFRKFVTHQSDLSSMLDFTPRTPNPRSSGIIDFAESLRREIPQAYEERKFRFRREYQEIVDEFILSFTHI